MISSCLKAFGLFIIIFCQSLFVYSQCPVAAGTEFITNGNFTSGNTGFTNAFTYFAGPGQLPGDNYGITTNPNPYNSGYFRNMGDHTSGTGNMLIFDFNNSSVNDPVYSTSVSVVNGQTYFFSAWFANIAINNTTACTECPGGLKITNSPILRFRLNGVNFATVRVDSITNNWNQYFTPYVATTTGPITIEIINIRGGSGSNDLALDDISFTNSCSQISNIDSYGRRTGLIDTVKACNVGFPYTLDTKLTSSNYTFRWLDNAGTTIPSQTNPTYGIPSTPGRYVVCYDSIADGLTGCWKKDTVVVVNTPLSINLGPDLTICSPFSSVLDAGLQNPPVTIQWSRNGTPIAGATAGTYTATSTGTYRVDATRSGCGSAFDQVVIANPVSSFSGTGTYCNTNNTANFSVTGATQVKWYTTATGGTALNPSNSDPTISTTHTATNTTSPGCASGLYAEDIGSYPGTLFASQPCSGATTNNNNNRVGLLINVSQTATLSSVDFMHNTAWGPTGTFTFELLNNNTTAGPNGRDGFGGVIYTQTSPSYTVGGVSVARTLTLTTPQILSPGKYWLSITGNNTPVGLFNCNPAANASDLWTSPVNDNVGGIFQAQKSIFNNGLGGGGGLFNIRFQVGSNNACSRLFVCASQNCPAPVEFYSFDATVNGNLVNLIWKTVSEKDNKGFEVEKSTDGINYFTIASIAGNGSNSATSLYQYTDKNAAAGLNYYRLKQIDFDGTISYSKTVSALVENTSLQIESVYPVPLKGNESLKININAPFDETITVNLTDMFGKVLFATNKVISIGKNTVILELDHLANGIYLVSIQHAQGKDIRTIVVE